MDIKERLVNLALMIGPFEFVPSTEAFQIGIDPEDDLEAWGVDFVMKISKSKFIGLQFKPDTYGSLSFQRGFNRRGNRLFTKKYLGKVFYCNRDMKTKKIIKENQLIGEIKEEIKRLENTLDFEKKNIWTYTVK